MNPVNGVLVGNRLDADCASTSFIYRTYKDCQIEMNWLIGKCRKNLCIAKESISMINEVRNSVIATVYRKLGNGLA